MGKDWWASSREVCAEATPHFLAVAGMTEPVLSSPGVERPIRRRTRRDPKPRFTPDTTAQLDAIRGCPSWQVLAGHLERAVQRMVGRFDLPPVAALYLSLGRQGFGPRNPGGGI